MTRARDVADSQDSLGGPVPPVVAGKNFQVNGGADFWQRGTTFASPTGQLTADRFYATQSAATATWSVSQTASFMAGSRYAIRTQRTSGQTGTPAFFLGSALETVDVIQLQGKTVTWSYYIKAGALYSGGGGGLGVQLNYGTGTDQGPFVGHTGEVALINTTIVISTTATRYQHTFTVPSNATSLRWNFAWSTAGTAGATDYYDVTNMQIEIGAVATPFSRAGGTIQGELAACQRYYQILGAGLGYAFSAGEMQLCIASTPMRATPTATMLTTTPYAESPPNVSARYGVASSTLNSPDVNRFTNQFLRINGFTGLTTGTNAFISAGQICLASEL
jgi:hypothetical protein